MIRYGAWAARWRVPLHFVAAVLVVAFARPTWTLLLAGAVLVLLGLVLRAWAAGHLRREAPLTVSGPYAHLRHPLYFGSAFIAAGFALAGGRPWLAGVLVLYFVLFYVPVMRREERERQARSELYAAYAAQVPAFLPWRRAFRGPAANAKFDLGVYWRNREWRATLGCAALWVLLYGKMVWG